MEEQQHWSPPEGERIAIIDGDIVAYSCSAVADTAAHKSAALSAVKDMMLNFIDALALDGHRLFLSGDGNFRKELSKTYKAQRKTEKPKYYWDCFEYLQNYWSAEVINGAEADDAIGIVSTSNPEHIVCTIDKDLDQLPVWHYNWRKYLTYRPTRGEATRVIWTQMLVGDHVDNIKGVRGIGVKKAAKILGDEQDEDKLFELVYNTYLENYETQEEAKEEFILNYKLLKILQSNSKTDNWKILERIA